MRHDKHTPWRLPVGRSDLPNDLVACCFKQRKVVSAKFATRHHLDLGSFLGIEDSREIDGGIHGSALIGDAKDSRCCHQVVGAGRNVIDTKLASIVSLIRPSRLQHAPALNIAGADQSSPEFEPPARHPDPARVLRRLRLSTGSG